MLFTRWQQIRLGSGRESCERHGVRANSSRVLTPKHSPGAKSIAPQLASGATDIRGELVASDEFVWEPVGTPAEYLGANLDPIQLSYQGAIADAQRAGARIERDVVIGTGAELGPGVKLRRVVIWDGEQVPDELEASDGVFAGGVFHPVG